MIDSLNFQLQSKVKMFILFHDVMERGVKQGFRFLLYLLYLLIVTEAGLRIGSHLFFNTPLLDVRRFRSDPWLIWKFNPGYRGELLGFRYAEINRDGFLGRDFEVTKPPGLVRVVALGGSVSFGHGASCMEGTFSASLERQLNDQAGKRCYEVVNAAVPGYSSWHGRQFVEHYLERLQPDVLLVAFGWNDSLLDLAPDGPPAVRRGKQFEYSPSFIFGATITGYLIHPLYQRFHESALYRRLLGSPPVPETPRVSVQDYQSNFLAMARWCQDRGVPVIFWTEPEPSYPIEASWALKNHRPYLEIIRQTAARDSIPLADAAAELSRENNREFFADPDRDWMHLNDQGQARVAAIVQKTLSQLGYLK